MKKYKIFLIKLLFLPFTILPLSWAQAIGNFIGKKVLILNKKRLKIVQTNLLACFPKHTKTQINDLTIKVASESGKWMMESAGTWFGNPEKLKLRITDKNRELMDAAFKKQKGVVVVLPHFGNWEMANFCLPQYYPCGDMYKPMNSETAEQIILDSRSRSGLALFPVNGRGVRKAFKHLKKGKVLVVLADHLPSREAGVYAPFFGLPALTGKLTHSLIRHNHSEAVLATTRRKPKGKGFELEFHPLKGMQTDDPVEAATQLNSAIEKAIMIAPEQYQWVYKRFDKQPRGEKNIYDE